MSDRRPQRPRRSSTRPNEHASSADPWWGVIDDEQQPAPEAVRESARQSGAPMQRIPVREVRQRLQPIAEQSSRVVETVRSSRAVKRARSMRVSDRARRIMVIASGVLVVLLGFACSFGVITLNNIVIKRSAELGKLEKQRKDLRSENALISADVARLAAPPLVTAKARKKLKMVTPSEMPQFIWEDPRNQTITPQMRVMMARRVANRLARQQAAAEAAQAAKAARAERVAQRRAARREAALAAARASSTTTGTVQQ